MSIYKTHLPKAFPLSIQAKTPSDQQKMRAMMDILSMRTGGYEMGSSFAYTADGPTLWLSLESARRLDLDEEIRKYNEQRRISEDL